MTKETVPSFWTDLFQAGIYKRNQGRVVRQVTFTAMFLVLLLAAWKVFVAFEQNRQSSLYLFPQIEYVVPVVLLVVGMWVAYRLVNYSVFADFLISVEAEMNKVSWPNKTELTRSSLVVIFMMFFLALILFGFDLTWQYLFHAIGVLHTK